MIIFLLGVSISLNIFLIFIIYFIFRYAKYKKTKKSKRFAYDSAIESIEEALDFYGEAWHE